MTDFFSSSNFDSPALIAINKIWDIHCKNLYTFFDTRYNRFLERESMVSYQVPLIDGMSLECMQNPQLSILVGRNNSEYVICRYNRQLLSVSKEQLLQMQISNCCYDNGTILLLGNFRLPDLSYIFDKDTFIFCEEIQSRSTGSKGEACKFLGKSKKTDLFGLIKFPLYNNSPDCLYEILYYEIAQILEIPSVRVEKGIYSGKECILSVFEYSKSGDQWRSFASYMNQYSWSESKLVHYFGIEISYYNAMLLDYLVGEADRHMSNLAICNNMLYPMFDNGRCFTFPIMNSSMQHRNYIERNIKSCSIDMWKRVQFLKKIASQSDKPEYRIILNNILRLEELYYG